MMDVNAGFRPLFNAAKPLAAQSTNLLKQNPDSFQKVHSANPKFGIGWSQPKDFISYDRLKEIIRDNADSGVEGSIKVLEARIKYREQHQGFVGFEQAEVNKLRREKAKLEGKLAAFKAKEAAIAKAQQKYNEAKAKLKRAVGANKKAAEDEFKAMEKKLKAAEDARNSAGNALNSLLSGLRALLGVNKRVKWEKVKY